jgi:conjugal transfer pilus assembly protein TraF
MRQEIFKQRLEDARAIMNMEESLESIRDYQLIEKEMYDKGIRLSEKWKLAAFKYPELFDHKKDPVNVHAVKLNRELEQEKLQLTVSKLARDYDLVLFMRGDCIYCKKFEPVLSEFALKYNFSVDAVTRDGTHSKNFKTFKFSSLPNYVKAMLQEDAVPQLIAVSKDGKNAFQLGNGLLTMSELEENSEMAIKVLESKVNENE